MNLNQAFWMGNIIRYLKLARSIKPTSKDLYTEFAFLEYTLSFVDLDDELEHEISKWVKKLAENYEKDSRITDDEALKLFQDATKWEDLINRLLLERPVLDLIRSGALNQKALLALSEGEPSAFIDEKTWNALSEIEKNDFSNAAKCLVAGIPTPAAMVALRGAEATVKKYYEFKTGDSAEKKMWGPIVRELKRRAKELKIKDIFLGYLDYIRDAKRNFAAHPNKIFDQREAELIFMEVINLVQDIYAEILQTSK